MQCTITYSGSNYPVFQVNLALQPRLTSVGDVFFAFAVAGTVCVQINGKHLSVGQGTMSGHRSMLGGV